MKRLIEGCKFFAASCIPGCGQMYQGYMKRGLSLMMVFCAVLALAIFLEMGALAVLLAPIWLYSFFDGYNLRRRLEGALVEDSADPDAYLFGMPEMDGRRFSEILGKRHSFVGWLLVAVGIFMLYQQIIINFVNHFFDWWIVSFLRWEVPRMMVTVLIIALGVWFIRGPRKRPDPPFIPPMNPGEPPQTAKAPMEEGLFQAPARPEAAEQEGRGDV